MTDTGTCNLMDDSKSNKKNINRRNKIIILTSQTFSVMQSHTGTSGSNVMFQIEVKKLNVFFFFKLSQKDELLVLT